MKQPTIDSETIQAVVNGYHDDPFSVLGPHNLTEAVVIRAFVPQASAVDIQTGAGESFPMAQLHPEGFYEALIPNRQLPLTYQLVLTNPSGETELYEDPYLFSNDLTDFDEYLLAEGTHLRIYDLLGAHLVENSGIKGVSFAVWAPNAQRVSVVGDFNNWDGRRHPMRFHHDSGIWDLFIPNLSEGILYKYEIKTKYMDYTVLKSDPVGYFSELRPNTASIVWDLDKYEWQDGEFMDSRPAHHDLNRPINVYEVHLGSWRRKNGYEWLTYAELADQMIPYVKRLGYTHIELMPISEHPYDGSWGYQVTGYFAVTSRYGTPQDFMAFVDKCHQAGIGVILDWVPAHFPRDQHGLSYFDGTFLYEHADPRQASQPDWGTLVFNYGRNEVTQFLLSNAAFWLDKYHIDGLRVDAVASMLYLDFSRKEGEWIPNRFGGRENLDAIDFLRNFNERIHEEYPGVLTIAEESTSWPGVTQPVSDGGLGFDLKWNMGWMHDTLQYMSNDPVYRSYHHGTLTFSLLYAFSEHFLLPFSHDEVVHLKKSMLDKMPGDYWQKVANLRALYAYQIAHPGKKMLFMGGEIGQWREWTEERSLDWHLLESNVLHQQLQDYVKALNHIYRQYAALYEDDDSWEGFAWLDLQNAQNSILSFSRNAPSLGQTLVIACNFTPVVRHNYRLGVPDEAAYREILNSDARKFGGSGIVNESPVMSSDTAWHNQPYSIEFSLPPLAVVIFSKENPPD